ncbi:hypothetical protein LPB136_09895 [Tenacibaculum todarodis]|uniref:Uncharacterized protein n=1 Tax=Tenacibaculum todarodis TaxID=1850252 RepID=A0A1L3JKN7_9FLAO|nr:hypothetical protein LPB136_09895 [Tenacibaculum todarodis]
MLITIALFLLALLYTNPLVLLNNSDFIIVKNDLIFELVARIDTVLLLSNFFMMLREEYASLK